MNGKFFIGALFLFGLFAVSTAEAADNLFDQTADQSASDISYPGNTNWYELGTGFHGTILSLTFRGNTDSNEPYASYLSLEEFNDPAYGSLNQVFVISVNAPFTGTLSDVHIDGLEITLEPNKYYRLVTSNGRQNVSVHLRGTNTIGRAKVVQCAFDVGCINVIYAFYPYIVSNAFPLRRPEALAQQELVSTTTIPEDGIAKTSQLVFSGTPNSPFADAVQMQVEVRPFEEPFTGADDGGILKSNFLPPGNLATVSTANLPDGPYHWRARTVDVSGNISLWQEFGEQGNVDFVVSTRDKLFNQILDQGSSDISYPGNTNWYELGTGFRGTIRSLTFRGNTDSNEPYASSISLEEFNDPAYGSLNQVLLISDNAPFTGTLSDVRIDGLNITLQPNKYYRLVTSNARQNVSVRLRGTNAIGRARVVQCLFNTGCLNIFYTFYPYIVAEGVREPVIIVPGITGSKLNLETSLFTTTAWIDLVKLIDPLDLWLSDLELPSSGIPAQPPNPQIRPIDILRKIIISLGLIQPEVFDYTETLISKLTDSGYIEGQDLFVFPYDWRLGISDVSEKFERHVREIVAQTRTNKVDIIAHSMGGLLAKEYIRRFGGSFVHQLVLVGVPNFGAPKAFKTLAFGDDLSIPGLNPSAVKSVSQNFPSIYQLLPSANYFVSSTSGSDFLFYGHYVNDATDVDDNGVRGELDFNQTRQLMINQGRNNQLFSPADALHSSIDSWRGSDFGVKTFNIVGCESPTLGQFILQNQLFGFIGKKFRPIYIDGDATVPLRSAESVGADQTFYYKTQSSPQKAKHSQLLTAPGMPELIGDILQDDVLILPTHITTQRSSCSLNGLKIEDDSPVELHIYDSQGRHVGPLPSGDIEIGIPGTEYDRFEDEKYAFLPPGETYRVVFRGTQAGEATISIQPILNGLPAQTVSYFDVPVGSASTTLELVLNQALDDLTLRLDHEGDGIVDATSTPTVILDSIHSLDFVPPETTAVASGTIGLNGWFTSDVAVQFSPNDESGGSGILKTVYSLDGGSIWRIYDSPIIINTEGASSILYQSVDRAGNAETVKKLIVKLDKTPPEAEIFFDLASQDLKVYGIDNLTPTQTAQNGKTFVIQDEAGHTLTLIFDELEKHGGEIKAELESLQYDDNSQVQIPETEFKFEWSLLGQAIKELRQQVQVANQFDAKAKYNHRNSETTIKIKELGSNKTDQKLPGLVLVKLITSSGSFTLKLD
ncbi:MAG: hypothetical protein HYT13_03150 [Candidatus Liptonbacteria bacterium]|nr:hypothetical protein [Candidatus Liptonbacteria bacterium]